MRLRRIALLAFMTSTASFAGEQPTEWVYGLRLTASVSFAKVSTKETQARLERACDDQLAKALQGLTSPRVLWRRMEPRRPDDERVSGRLTALVVTPVAVASPDGTFVLMGEVRPGRPLALYRVRFILDDRRRALCLPTDAEVAGSLELERTREERLEGRRAHLLERVYRALNEVEGDIARTGKGPARLVWRHDAHRATVTPHEADTEWVLPRLRVEALLVGPDVQLPLDLALVLDSDRPQLVEKLEVLGCAMEAPTPKQAPAPPATRGLAETLDPGPSGVGLIRPVRGG